MQILSYLAQSYCSFLSDCLKIFLCSWIKYFHFEDEWDPLKITGFADWKRLIQSLILRLSARFPVASAFHTRISRDIGYASTRAIVFIDSDASVGYYPRGETRETERLWAHSTWAWNLKPRRNYLSPGEIQDPRCESEKRRKGSSQRCNVTLLQY